LELAAFSLLVAAVEAPHLELVLTNIAVAAKAPPLELAPPSVAISVRDVGSAERKRKIARI
jgi:hypothetical protein